MLVLLLVRVLQRVGAIDDMPRLCTTAQLAQRPRGTADDCLRWSIVRSWLGSSPDRSATMSYGQRKGHSIVDVVDDFLPLNGSSGGMGRELDGSWLVWPWVRVSCEWDEPLLPGPSDAA